MVGLADRGDHCLDSFQAARCSGWPSGRALINDPKIILADEPTGNLDSATSKMIFELFSELNMKGLTLIIVTTTWIWQGRRRRCIRCGTDRS